MGSMLNLHILFLWLVISSTLRDSLGIQEVTVLEGTFDVQLACPSVKVNEKSTTYSWYYNGNQLNDDCSKYNSVRAEKLIFFTISRNDSGTYLCHFQNDEVSYNHTFLVQVNYPPEFCSIPEPLYIKDKYTDVFLNCDVDGKPIPKVEWLKDGQLLQTHGRFLTLHSITSADEGSYQCNATNEYGSVMSGPMEVSFYVPVYFITFLPDKIDVDCHGNVTLECKADGKPNPIIHWFRYDKYLQSDDSLQIKDKVLMITNVTSHWSGTYTCIAWNSDGDTQHQIQQSTYVSVKSVPEAMDVSLRFIDTRTVSIVWHPGSDGGYSIKYIQIEYCQFIGNKTAWFTLPPVEYQAEKQKSYAIRDLQPNGHYQLNIQAINEIGASPTTTVNFTIFSKENRVVRQSPKQRDVPLPSNISKSGFIVFIAIGVLIAFGMLLFIIIVIVSFCRLFCHRSDTSNVFDDEIYTGAGIENPDFTTESYELLDTKFDVIQRKESSQQLIQLD